MVTTSAVSQLQRAIVRMRALCVQMPEFLIPFATIRAKMREIDDSICTTSAAWADGTIGLNPKYLATLPDTEIPGLICHELLHLQLRHHERQNGRDSEDWNDAADCCINSALRSAGVALPQGALYPDRSYSGELNAEAYYDFLQKNPSARQVKNKRNGSGNGSGSGAGAGTQAPVAAGCGVRPANQSPNAGQNQDQSAQTAQGSGQPNWDHLAREAVSYAKAAGRGSSPIVTLLSPVQPRADWKSVLRHGSNRAAASLQRSQSTYARAGRRSRPGIVTPGKTGTQPALALVIDVSGSMHCADWMNQILAEANSIIKMLGIRIFVVAHTSEVVFAEWVSPSASAARLENAFQYSGGTDAAPAYARVRAENAKFDTLVHFTDCELCGDWPAVPAKKLYVGAFGSGAQGHGTQPPDGSIVIPCWAEG